MTNPDYICSDHKWVMAKNEIKFIVDGKMPEMVHICWNCKTYRITTLKG